MGEDAFCKSKPGIGLGSDGSWQRPHRVSGVFQGIPRKRKDLREEGTEPLEDDAVVCSDTLKAPLELAAPPSRDLPLIGGTPRTELKNTFAKLLHSRPFLGGAAEKRRHRRRPANQKRLEMSGSFSGTIGIKDVSLDGGR